MFRNIREVGFGRMVGGGRVSAKRTKNVDLGRAGGVNSALLVFSVGPPGSVEARCAQVLYVVPVARIFRPNPVPGVTIPPKLQVWTTGEEGR